MIRLLLLAIAGAVTVAAQPLSLHVEADPVPPGAMAQVRVYVSGATASLHFSVGLDPVVFGPIESVEAHSATGDQYGYASFLTNTSVAVRITSPSSGLGRLPDVPVFTLMAPVQSHVSAGQQSALELSSAAEGLATRSGLFAADGTFSVRRVIPSLGFVDAGDRILIEGTGFDPDTHATLDGVATGPARVVSREWIEFTALAPADLTGRRLHVRSTKGQMDHWLSWRPAAFPSISSIAAPILPLFPARQQTITGVRLGRGPATAPWLAVRNVGRLPAHVFLEELPAIGPTLQSGLLLVNPDELTICACNTVRSSTSRLISSQPVQVLTLPVTFGAVDVARPEPTSVAPLELELSRESVTAVWRQGAAAPAPAEIRVLPVRERAIPFRVTTEFLNGSGWFRVNPLSGEAMAFNETLLNIAFTPPKDLAPGVYRGRVLLSPVTDALQRPYAIQPTIDVTLTVQAQNAATAPDVTVEPSSLDVSLTEGGGAERTLHIRGLSEATAPEAVDRDGLRWLSVSPYELKGDPATLTVTLAAELPPGIYTGTVQVASVLVPVTLRVTPAATGPRNAIGLRAGMPLPWRIAGDVAPGGTVTIHGNQLGEDSHRADGLRVTFDGIPATIRGQSATHIEVDVPQAVTGRAFTMLEVEWFGLRSRPWGVPVVSASPR